MPDGTQRLLGSLRHRRPASPRLHSTVPGYLSPNSVAAVRELAELIGAAEWAPPCYRSSDGNYAIEKIVLGIMHGAAVGLGPFAAVHAIAVIDGHPTIWGDGALALVERSGLIQDMREDYIVDSEEGLTAICTMRRRPWPTPITRRFSIAMADEAGLTQKPGPWQTYRRRMLMMRARSWALRDGFADVLRGLSIREEVEDYAGTENALPEPALAPSPRRPSSVNDRVAPRPRLADHVSPRSAGPRVQREATRPPIAEPAQPIDPRSCSTGTGASVLMTAEIAAANGSTGDDAVINTVDQSLADGRNISAASVLLRDTFERLFADPHLSPDQVLGLWESNEPARDNLAEAFGAEVLAEADCRRAAAEQERNRRHRSPATDPSTASSTAGRSRSKRSKIQSGTATTKARPPLEIDPNWPDETVFQHYRARLIALKRRRAKAATLDDFRSVNLPIEERLRERLPHLMTDIDAIYA